jgi:hypothetical protein
MKLARAAVKHQHRGDTHAFLRVRARASAGHTACASPQQLFCSFDGTAVLIRAFRSPMQVCENRGGRGILKNKQF